MDQLESQFHQSINEAISEDAQPAETHEIARVLIAASDARLATHAESLLRTLDCRTTKCGTIAEARSVITRQRFDLIIVGPLSGELDSIDLLHVAQKASPASKTVMLAPAVTAAAAIQAMRCGAVDLIALPLHADDFRSRIESALVKAREETLRDRRLMKLKRVCRELNMARQEISKQVDSLCDDLAHVYEDIAEQMSEVALAAEFRTLLRQELDVEDLLRTTLEYMLTKTGPTNAAIFLPDGSTLGGDKSMPAAFGLGAYVNCDCPRETVSAMLDRLGEAVCPQMAEEDEIVRFTDASEFADWIGGEAGALAESNVIAFRCAHKGECLAVFVLFRSRQQPFDERLAATLDTMRSIIAEQLRNVIKVHHRAAGSEWPNDAEADDLDYGFSEGDDNYGLAA